MRRNSSRSAIKIESFASGLFHENLLLGLLYALLDLFTFAIDAPPSAFAEV